MHPVTGPHNTRVYNGYDGAGSWDIHKTGYKQAKPYNFNLFYGSYRCHTLSITSSGNWGYIGHGGFGRADVVWSTGGFYQPHLPIVYLPSHPWVSAVATNARAKLLAKISESASNLVTLAEREQAMNMIARRAGQLYQFARALRKGRFGDAAKVLSVPKGFRPRSKSFAGAWLEYHFGWAPMVRDIGASCSILSSPIPMGTFKGSSRGRFRDGREDTYGQYPGGNGSYGKCESNRTVTIGVSCRANVTVDNPNLYLAARLGLTNPATVAWELVPFSFVVDWFANVSDFLNQFSDFHGLNVTEAFWSYKAEETCSFKDQYFDYDPSYPDNNRIRVGSYFGMSTQRNLGIPEVRLGVRAPWTLSPTRALTSISLLIQKGLK